MSSLIVALLCVGCPMTNAPEVYSLPQDLQGTMQDYQADVYFLMHELPKRHENVYHTLSRSAYEERVADLFVQCGDLEPLAAAVRIKEFVAAIGDAHTSYTTPMPKAAALNIVWLEDPDDLSDHIYVTAALDGSLVRSDGVPARIELVSINGVPIFPTPDRGIAAEESLLERLIPIVSHEEGNLFTVKNTLTYHLLDPKLLYGLGVIESPEGPVPMTFSDSSPSTVERDLIEVIETSLFQEQPWSLYYTDAAYQDRDRSVLPFYLREAQRNYTYHYDVEYGILHILYNRCQTDPDLSFTDFVKQAFAAIPDMVDLRAVVVDLRNNSGGDSRLIKPLYGRLDDLPESVQLFAAISPKTFSSGLMNAIDLDRRYSRLTLIGRPTGGKPNHYGEVRSVRLPTGNYISYSTSYFTNLQGNDDPYLVPEISIPLTVDDYFSTSASPAVGTDPVLAYVLDQLD